MRIAVNGFGRIGRVFVRNIINAGGIELIAINDLADTKTLAHLFKYDSVHGGFKGTIDHDAQHLYLDGKKTKIFAGRDPSALPWKNLDIDLVIESTGKFISKEGAVKHL